jgi:mono/diheme cytochrome c family protein
MRRANTRSRILAAAVGLAVVGAVAVTTSTARGQSGVERTIRDGVFSARQVERGRRLFHSICMNCHEIEEFTGPGAYLEEVEGKPLWETFEFVWSEMPEDDPASLNPEDYIAVLSYFFSVYGLPTGPDDLPIDQPSLEKIAIIRPIPTE